MSDNIQRTHKIGIISDTHGMLRPIVTETLKGCDAIFHAGDVGKKGILDALGKIAPVYAVRGNNDDWADFAKGSLASQSQSQLQSQSQKSPYLPETLSVELYGIRFFMVHDKLDIPKENAGYDVVIYGHSHKYEERHCGRRLMLNPGSCGPKRFTLPVTMAVMEIAEDGSFHIKRINLDEIIAGNKGANPDLCATEIRQRKTENDSTNKAGWNPFRRRNGISGAYDMKRTVRQVMQDTEKGLSVDKIADKRGISRELAEQICRLYLTHPGVDAEGIMRKMGM